MRASQRAAGVLALAAGLVHGGLGPEHFAEWWGYGLFFVVAASAQVVLGLALLLDAFEGEGLQRATCVAGIAGNAFLILLYVVSRTAGIPFFGPGAGEVEDVALIDVLTVAAEAAIVLL